MSESTLPLLPLHRPTILLPTARLTLPISKPLADALSALMQGADTPPMVAAIPLSAADPAVLHRWGTAARVLRLVRPAGRTPSGGHLLTVLGLARVQTVQTRLEDEPGTELVHAAVAFPPDQGTGADAQAPSRDAVIAFRSAALRLIDRLGKDTAHAARRETYGKIANMLEEIEDERAPWMADVIVSAIAGEYDDKLEYLSTPDPSARLRLATAQFLKQASIAELTRKIAQSIDESLSKQQKQFFLRQQLAAIHRELAALRASSSSPSANAVNRANPDAANANVNGAAADPDSLDADEADAVDLRAKIEAMGPGTAERQMAAREWRRLQRIPQGSVEHGVIRSYLEWLTAIPWPASAPSSATTTTTTRAAYLAALRDRAFLANARAQLDADHYGLAKIKRRLVEYLAVVRLKELRADEEARAAGGGAGEGKGAHNEEPAAQTGQAVVQTEPPKPQRRGIRAPILLFVGPPGTGKTSLGQSIARALNRPFQRISLGGVCDEAEIRGHRRTYVASGPGMVVQALRKAGRPDPVVLLDEIDKVGQSNFHGDPGAALLEVLDPEQNHTFTDHYINVPIDLSQVLFICTSNTLETIAPPLLDRCEVIHLSGYTYDEKMHIARRFLLPAQLAAHGLAPNQLTLTEPALLSLATHYTREAGVRSLARAIGAVARAKVVAWAEHTDASAFRAVVDAHELEAILGVPRWDAEESEREERRGLVYGLVVTGMGEGGVLPVETVVLPGTGKLMLTGSLGEVIKESGELALSWVKTHAYDLCITHSRSQDPLKVPELIDIHLHLPSGAVKKDGPSAGIAMTCAFVSLLTGACVPSHIAMTGEMTLRGRVGAVGGIKEKVLGAHRAQITKVILPWANRKDVEHDVPAEVRAQMEFAFVRTAEEALEAAFGKEVLGWRAHGVVLESRL